MSAATDLAAGHSPSLRYSTQRGYLRCTWRACHAQREEPGYSIENSPRLAARCCRELQLRHSQSHRSVTLPGLVEVTASRSPAGHIFRVPWFCITAGPDWAQNPLFRVTGDVKSGACRFRAPTVARSVRPSVRAALADCACNPTRSGCRRSRIARADPPQQRRRLVGQP